MAGGHHEGSHASPTRPRRAWIMAAAVCRRAPGRKTGKTMETVLPPARQADGSTLCFESETMIPTRFTNLDRARARFGDRVDRLAPFLLRGDPLADALVEAMEHMPSGKGFSTFQDALRRPTTKHLDLPPAMRAFFDEVEYVPA